MQRAPTKTYQLYKDLQAKRAEIGEIYRAKEKTVWIISERLWKKNHLKYETREMSLRAKEFWKRVKGLIAYTIRQNLTTECAEAFDLVLHESICRAYKGLYEYFDTNYDVGNFIISGTRHECSNYLEGRRKANALTEDEQTFRSEDSEPIYFTEEVKRFRFNVITTNFSIS